MFKRSLSLFLAVMLLAGVFSSFSAGAQVIDKAADSSQTITLTLKVEFLNCATERLHNYCDTLLHVNVKN